MGLFFGEQGLKSPHKKDHFMDAELVRKTLKIFNLTTTYAILMKLTIVMYFYKIFVLAKELYALIGCERT